MVQRKYFISKSSRVVKGFKMLCFIFPFTALSMGIIIFYSIYNHLIFIDNSLLIIITVLLCLLALPALYFKKVLKYIQNTPTLEIHSDHICLMGDIYTFGKMRTIKFDDIEEIYLKAHELYTKNSVINATSIFIHPTKNYIQQVLSNSSALQKFGHKIFSQLYGCNFLVSDVNIEAPIRTVYEELKKAFEDYKNGKMY